ncbi:MAG: DUF3536 domain-containing protein [Acidobacteria bacterium]|nr:DUF3536 domain-containing protein [Acidobacteriota bacterium]
MAPTAEKHISAEHKPATPAARYVCVHGHFYQPPRENPWLETVEQQASAAPFHDWNARITAECYSPNSASRILNKQDKIVRITNNYARMSFNFGPTLLSWLQEYAPRTYAEILRADTLSAQRFSGHGSAMAQVYNHIIMPLANDRDARTQIRWGILDFEHRFRRRPEGMWLAETGVNAHILDLLAQEGIRFTVLAPSQAARFRVLGEDNEEWTEVTDGSIDTTHPYLVRLPEGRSIAVFFYDGPTSRAIAFEGLLNSGEHFGERLASRFRPTVYDNNGAPVPQLVHVATDGESYGHHHKHGDMALAYAMHYLEEQGLARLTNYGEFLEKFLPQWEAEVVENTAWSCSHGIERWQSDCGCSGGKPGWNQQWRAPLRSALDQLRDDTAKLTDELGDIFFRDVWAARDAYLRVILNRSPENEDAFFEEFARHELSAPQRVRALELMELQRHTQLMYTSCGWFFDDISGIETVQIIAYAGRVLELARKLWGHRGLKLEKAFLDRLAEARSNLPDPAHGEAIFERWVRPLIVDLQHVGAHYSISSIFRPYPEEGSIFCFNVQRLGEEVFTSGRGRLAIGRAQVQSRITHECEDVTFAVLHLGDQNLSAAVCGYTDENAAAFEKFANTVRDAMAGADLPEVIRQIDAYFGKTAYSLSSLFHDEQQRILHIILDATVSEVENSLRTIYSDHASLLNYLSRVGMPAPPALGLAAGFAINASLRQAMESEAFDAVAVRSLLDRAISERVQLNPTELAFSASECITRTMRRLEDAADPQHARDILSQALDIAATIHAMPFEVDMWEAQNIWYRLLLRSGGLWALDWRDQWMRLGEALDIDTENIVLEIAAAPEEMIEA